MRATARAGGGERAKAQARGPATSRAARARSWMAHDCFPFWADRAVHPKGGFRERLALDGGPLDDEVSRVRVQARQTYVFARAALMGWRPRTARALVEAGVASLLGPCQRRDGLFGRLVRLGVGLEDDEPDLYDNAFGVLALAWAARALDAPELVAEADRVLGRIDADLSHPAGGYVECLPPRLPRRQNPHMHLFEACLALFEASGDERHLDGATSLLALFETHFVDPATGHVRELFDDNLVGLDGSAAAWIQPGHAFEWVALLERYRRITGAPVRISGVRLYAAAVQELDSDGFSPLRAHPGAAPPDPSRRTWAQTEALRAHLARATVGDDAAVVRARRLFDAIFATHLDPAPPGAWIDHLDTDGHRRTDSITAATGYHLVAAFTEAMEHPAMGSPDPA